MLKKIKKYYLILFGFFPLVSISQDLLRYEGTVARETINKKSMLNYYLIDDYIYSDKGFYIVSDNTIQYEMGFFCLSTLSILDSNKILESLPYQLRFIDFKDSIKIEKREICFDYSKVKNRNHLLKKINSKKFRNTNYPILYAFDHDQINGESLKVCYVPLNAKIIATPMPEHNFKRYVFDGKQLKIKEIKFYYISELEIEGQKIR